MGGFWPIPKMYLGTFPVMPVTALPLGGTNLCRSQFPWPQQYMCSFSGLIVSLSDLSVLLVLLSILTINFVLKEPECCLALKVSLPDS